MLHLGKRLAQVHAVSSRQLVILANLVISLGDGPVIFGLSLIFLDHSIDVSTHDMGNAGPMLLGGVLKLLGRRDRRTLQSEERRGGTEGVRTCSFRCVP